MASWAEVERAAPELIAAVRQRFDANGHKTMATLRRDGSPRISGTETMIRDGELWLGGMPGSVKCADLRRDGRVALHSASEPPQRWKGDAKVAGRAVLVTDPAVLERFAGEGGGTPFDLFRIELSEVVTVSLGEPADHLLIESWHEGRGVSRVERR